MTLPHLDASGRARMVDVGAKEPTVRHAVAEGRVIMSPEAFRQVRDATLAKGDVVDVAAIAGMMGAKRTAELVPLCHPIALDEVRLDVDLEEDWPGVRITARARATARTGVEMEAMTAVSIACLAVYDMVKGVDRGTRIASLRLLEKTGGVRGDWRAPPDSNPEETA